MRTKILAIALAAAPLWVSAQQKSQTWCPDNGDGTYTNPVLNADYSDPDVCVGASGKDYYLTASSFQCIPGLPILHSTDLVNWEIVGHALKKLTPDSVFNKPAHGMGVWAPAIRYHQGYYYIYWGDPDYGVMMVRTTDPAGEWEAPVCVVPGKGMIDTCPLWDDDGRCYLVNGWAGSRAGFNSQLTVRELSKDGTKAISNPVIVYDGGNANHTAEGPKFYKYNGYYWIMCPAGGVKEGWQLAMRSKSPYGPYECKKVLEQGSTDVHGPHQGGWVHTAYGEDWFMHFNDKYAYGRVVWLQPVEWRDGWPVMGKAKKGSYCGEPYYTYRKPKSGGTSKIVNPAESDEFNTTELGKQWQWHANYDQRYGMPTADGFFRLFTFKESYNFKSLWEAPNLLLQKTPADEFTATTKVRFGAKEEGQYGGLVMMGRGYSALVVQRVGDKFELQRRTCPKADKGGAETVTAITTLKPTEVDKIQYQPAIYETIYLRLKVKDSKVDFFYSLDGKNFKPAGEQFTMREGHWIGAKFGYVAETTKNTKNQGFLDVDWMHVNKD